SLAAAKATLKELRKKKVLQHIARLNVLLRESYNRMAQELNLHFTKCVGLDYRTMITFDASAGDPLEMKSLMQQELLRYGVLWNGFHNLSFSHKHDDVMQVISAYGQALSVLKWGVENKQVRTLIQGELIEPMFRRVANFHQKPSGAKK